MLHNLRQRIVLVKPSKKTAIRMVPWLVYLTLLLLTISLGVADPGGGTPPGPT